MEVKTVFAVLALLLLLQLLLRWVIADRVMAKPMTPAEILRWRMINREIDACEYEVRKRIHIQLARRADRCRVVVPVFRHSLEPDHCRCRDEFQFSLCGQCSALETCARVSAHGCETKEGVCGVCLPCSSTRCSFT